MKGRDIRRPPRREGRNGHSWADLFDQVQNVSPATVASRFFGKPSMRRALAICQRSCRSPPSDPSVHISIATPNRSQSSTQRPLTAANARKTSSAGPPTIVSRYALCTKKVGAPVGICVRPLRPSTSLARTPSRKHDTSSRIPILSHELRSCARSAAEDQSGRGVRHLANLGDSQKSRPHDALPGILRA